MGSFWKSDALFKSETDAYMFIEQVAFLDLGYTSPVYHYDGTSIYAVTYMTDDEHHDKLIQVINDIRRDYVRA